MLTNVRVIIGKCYSLNIISEQNETLFLLYCDYYILYRFAIENIIIANEELMHSIISRSDREYNYDNHK